MAYESKMEKGRKFQNHQEGRHFDKVRGEEKAAKSKKSAPKEEGEGENQPIHEVVKAHGPAHSSQIEKSEGDQYSMHSEHEDGHKHSSHGHSLHEAHNESMQAHGEPGGMGEPDGDEAQGMPMGGQGQTPPGMGM